MNVLNAKRIKLGNQYNQLIDDSNCQYKDLGFATNVEGIEFMADLANEYAYHVKKLANHLYTGHLKKDVNKTHKFLWDHLDYDPDDALQKLRSPGCSWAQRFEGIDCKSVTLFAAAILKQMGYYSYMRQIKQPGVHEDHYTHVYNVVPINQNTGKLNEGYYVVDGTLSDNKEVPFIQKRDVMINPIYNAMNGGCTPKRAKQVVKASNAGRRLYNGKSTGGRDLAKWRHHGMLSPNDENNTEQAIAQLISGGGNDENNNNDNNNDSDFIADLAESLIGNAGEWFQNNCSWYCEEDYESDVNQILSTVNDYLSQFNIALENGNFQNASIIITKLLHTPKIIADSYAWIANQESDATTESILNTTKNVALDFDNALNDMINTYLNEYFSVQSIGTVNIATPVDNGNYSLPDNVAENTANAIQDRTKTTLSITPNDNTTIPKLTFTQNTLNQIIDQDANVDTTSFLNELTEVAITIGSGVIGGGSQNNNNNGNPNGGTNQNNGNNETIAGINKSYVGWGAAAVALGLIFKDPIKKALK